MSREPNEQGGDKTSIIFATPHEAGRLYAVLRLFAESQINLTRIVAPDEIAVKHFLDFIGSGKDEKVREVLRLMEALTISMKVLGSYPAVTNVSA